MPKIRSPAPQDGSFVDLLLRPLRHSRQRNSNKDNQMKSFDNISNTNLNQYFSSSMVSLQKLENNLDKEQTEETKDGNTYELAKLNSSNKKIINIFKRPKMSMNNELNYTRPDLASGPEIPQDANLINWGHLRKSMEFSPILLKYKRSFRNRINSPVSQLTKLDESYDFNSEHSLMPWIKNQDIKNLLI